MYQKNRETDIESKVKDILNKDDSNDKMDEDSIAKLFASMNLEAVEIPKQDEEQIIEADNVKETEDVQLEESIGEVEETELELEVQAEKEEELELEEDNEATKAEPSNEKMDEDSIAKLFASMNAKDVETLNQDEEQIIEVDKAKEIEEVQPEQATVEVEETNAELEAEVELEEKTIIKEDIEEPKTEPSNEKMDEDSIAKLFASMNSDRGEELTDNTEQIGEEVHLEELTGEVEETQTELETEAEREEETKIKDDIEELKAETSNDKMDEDSIAKLFASMNSEAVETPKQDEEEIIEIAKPEEMEDVQPEQATEEVEEPESELETEVEREEEPKIKEDIEEPKFEASNEKMDEDSIAKLFTSMNAEAVETPSQGEEQIIEETNVKETEAVQPEDPTAEVEAPDDGLGVESEEEPEPQEDIEETRTEASNEKMDEDSIAKLFASMNAGAVETPKQDEEQITEVTKQEETEDVQPESTEIEPEALNSRLGTDLEMQEEPELEESIEQTIDKPELKNRDLIEVSEAESTEQLIQEESAVDNRKVTPEKYKRKAKKPKKQKDIEDSLETKVKKPRKTKKELLEEKAEKTAEKARLKIEKEEERERLKEERAIIKQENRKQKADKKKEKRLAKKEKDQANKRIGKEKQPKTNPLISVLLVTYNPQMAALEELLQSINEQNYKNIKLIICDDNSNQISEEDVTNCIKACITEIPFEIHRNEETVGLQKCYEQLIEVADGDYMAFCRQEDIWLQGKIKRYVVETEENDYSIVCSDIIVVDDEGDEIAESIRKINKNYIFKCGEGLAPQLLFDNFVIGGTMMMQSTLAKRALPLCTVMEYDHYLALHAAKTGSIGFIGRSYTKHRFYSDDEILGFIVNDRATYVKDKINKSLEYLKWLEENFECDEELKNKIQDAILWTLARRENLRPRLSAAKEIWRYREFSLKTAIFEIIVGKLPRGLVDKVISKKN